MPLALERGKILSVTIVEIDCRDDAVIQCSNTSDAFPLTLVNVHHWLQSLPRELCVALWCGLFQLLLMLIHLVIWIATGCVWASSLTSLYAFKVLTVHVPAVSIHLHESAGLFVKELKLNLVVVGSRRWCEIPTRYGACVASCRAHIDLCILLEGSVGGRWGFNWNRWILLERKLRLVYRAQSWRHLVATFMQISG